MSGVRRRQVPWLWLTLAAAGLSSWWWLPPLLQLFTSYWSLSWEERDQRASVVGMAIGAGSAVLSMVSIRQNRHLDSETPQNPVTRSNLRALPRMKALAAGRARIHQAMPLTGGVAPRRRWWTPRRAIDTTLNPDLPLFVRRDLSNEVTDWMQQARRTGGFLLLVGTSSVGKTRLLFETARQELGGFRVLVPDLGDGEAVNMMADTPLPGPIVVWLDELQRFLAGPYFVPNQTAGHAPIMAGALSRLLDGGTPVIVLATLWPDYLDQLRATDIDAKDVTKPRHPAATDVLALQSTRLRVETFSAAEKQRARELGTHDPRLALAAADGADFNVTETLAGAPRIMQRYQEATETRRAVIHAVIDARRLGIQGPLAYGLLRDAARGYLTEVHPEDTWFDHALTELTRRDRREDAATAPLLTLSTANRRDVLGYTVTDYLLQELLRQRRSALLTDITWNALVRHTHNPDDRRRLAQQAEQRMQYRHAQHLHRTLADASSTDAAFRLAKMLAKQGKVEELRTRADSGDTTAAYRLVELLVQQSRVDEALALLRTRADSGDTTAAYRLVELLVQQSRVDEALALLRTRADSGDIDAAHKLAELLAKQGKVEELRARADTGDTTTAHLLAELLVKRGWVGDALVLLRDLADGGDTDAAHKLAKLLVEQDEVDDALTLLRDLADTDDTDSDNPDSAHLLAELLVEQDEVDDALTLLRDLADTGDADAAFRLAELLAKQGKVEELRLRADSGDIDAAHWLAELLAKQGKVEELRLRADTGDTHATHRLIGLLAKQGRVEELRTRADSGDTHATRRLVGLLVERGRVDDALALLRTRAGTEAGDTDAAYWLAELLAEQGRVDEALVLLRTRADTEEVLGVLPFAAGQLAELLAKQGRVEELRTRADSGDSYATSQLVELLVEQGRVEELRARADAGGAEASRSLTRMLAEQGQVQLLRNEVHAGTEGAQDSLIELLRGEGRVKEAERLRLWGLTSDGEPSDPW